jgi:hypothetical protein
MIDTIMAKFSEKVFNACERHAGKLGLNIKDVQLVLSLTPEQEVKYALYQHYAHPEVVTFNQVLGVKMDFKGYGFIVPPFIKDKLLEFAAVHKVGPEKVSAMLLPADIEKREIITWLYIDGTAIEQIILQDLIET